MDQQFDFTVIERAKLTQKEFGDLCGVTRVTANLWMNDKMGPHRYIRENVGRVLTAVAQALDNDRLPLPDDTPREMRSAAIHAALYLPASTDLTT